MKTAAVIKRDIDRLVPKLRRAYPFLEHTIVDVVTDYGQTAYTTARQFGDSDFILVGLEHLKEIWNTKRLVNRLGHYKEFGDFVLVCLLHEIAHVHQQFTIPPNRLLAATLEIQDGDHFSHDESWIEIEADKWARRELKKWVV